MEKQIRPEWVPSGYKEDEGKVGKEAPVAKNVIPTQIPSATKKALPVKGRRKTINSTRN